MSNFTPSYTMDGLPLFWGPAEAQNANGGEYKTFGLERVTEIEVDLTTLTTTSALISRIVFPKGKVLSKVVVICDEVLAGTATSFDFGVVSAETSPTVNDPDGIIDGLLAAQLSTLGETTEFREDTAIPASTAGGGVLIGTVIAAENDVHLNLVGQSVGGTATAGHIKLQLHWYKSSVR